MALSDQIENFTTQELTGVYIDDVFIGDVFYAAPTPNFEFVRERIANSVSRIINQNVFARKNIPYSGRLSYVSGAHIKSGTSLRFFSAFSSEEFYYDSFLPSPAAIGDINGAGRPLLSTTLNGFSLGSEIPANENFNRIGTSEESLHVWFSGDGQAIDGSGLTFPANSFIDDEWQLGPYPFQTKYKLLPRTVEPEKSFSSFGKITTDINGTALPEEITTNKIGSLFVAYANAEFSNWAEFSQIWSVTSSLAALPKGDNKFNHRAVKNWNSVVDVTWNNFSGSGEDLYAAVGLNGAFLLSYDGIKWQTLAAGIRPAADPNATDDLVVIDTTPQPLGTNNYLRIHAEGYNDGSTSGHMARWYAIVSNQVVRTTAFGDSVKVPPKTGWISENIAGDVGASFIGAYDIGTTDPGGNESLTTICVAVVGDANANSGLIAFANKNGGSWNRNNLGVANQAYVTWHSFAVGNSTHSFMYVCGEDRAITPNQGIIARAPFSATSPHTQTWSDITPSAASLGLTDIPVLNDIDYSETGNILVAVGESGFIIRSSDGGATWSLRTPPNSYTGNYSRVTAVHGTGLWYAVGANGAIHYSNDQGLSWNEADLDRPNTVSLPTINCIFAGSRATVDSTATLQQNNHLICGGNSIKSPFNQSGKTTIMVFRLLDASFSLQNGINGAALVERGEFLSGSSLLTPSVSDYNKTFFGFGEGLDIDLSEYAWGGKIKTGKNLLPSFGDFAFYDFYGPKDACTIRLYNPKIRGWKYGTYNGNPTPTAAVFRYNRYGQLRDMLEQRKYTALALRENGKITVTYPVDVSFVSGTFVAASASLYNQATQQTAFNPEDSGTYDFHYRAGKPFNDADSRV